MRKILWPEGLLLSQQHFQYEAHQQLETARDTMALIQRDFWGFVEYHIEINETATLQSAQVRLPSGEWIAVDEPIHLALPDLDHAQIFLCLPLNNRVSELNGYSEHDRHTRWRAVYQMVSDDYDPTRQQELVLAEGNWFLSLNPPDDSNWYFKIAEVIRKQGRWAKSSEFWPSVCRIGACQEMLESFLRLQSLLRQHIEALSQYQHAMRWRMTSLMQILTDAELACQAIDQGYIQHPWEGYHVLLRLQRLLGCHVESKLESAYQHHHLHGSIHPLMQAIREQLNVVHTQLPHPVDLINVEPFTYQANLESAIRSRNFSLYLAVSNIMETPDITQRCSQLITISSSSIMPRLRTRALPGITLSLCRHIPSQLFIKPGYVYFRLEPDEYHWPAIKKEASVMMYVNREFSDSTIEIYVVNHDE